MSTTYRVLSDTLYRSVALVTTANVVTEAYDTDAYGNTLCYSGPGTDGEWFTDDDVRTNNPINTTIFTGRQYDPESQIYWYRARYYSPQIGRFLSRDPLKSAELSQGPNLYWYVRNNPPNTSDPTGEFVQLIIGGVIISVSDALLIFLATCLVIPPCKDALMKLIQEGARVFCHAFPYRNEPNGPSRCFLQPSHGDTEWGGKQCRYYCENEERVMYIEGDTKIDCDPEILSNDPRIQ